jgi:ABC-type amino acid transport substrate-binding protein
MRKPIQVGIVAFLLGGCTGAPVEEEPAANVRMDVQPGLTIATDATFPPFHYFDDDARVTGFDVELARALSERAGYGAQAIAIPYDVLFEDLLAGAYEVVAATTGITPERERKYLFSDPYYDTCQAALVRAGSGEPQSLADLAGRRVGAAGAGTSVKALDNLPDAIHVLLSEREATEDTIKEDGSVPVLESGDIDALVVDEMDAVEAARASNGRLRVLREPVALEQYGFVFSPGNARLRDQFDRALAAMRADGSLEALRREFGLDRGDDWPIDLP